MHILLNKTDPDKVLDLKGLKCPAVEFETAKALQPMESGSVVLVIADDPVAEDEVPSWCEQTGNNLIDLEKREALRFIIQKP